MAQDWRPTSRYSVAAWVVFYVGFLIYAFSRHGAFLFIDMANLVVHEGGHLLFGWFGPTLGLWGGTILQWLVPLLLATYFFSQRQATAFAFCSFFFFENWLYTATYMADARAMILPLVTAGDSDYVEHDWHTIFSSLGVLQYDTKIAAVVSFLGWLGMLGTVFWLIQRSVKDPAAPPLVNRTHMFSSTNHIGTAVLSCPVERSSTRFLPGAKRERSFAPPDGRVRLSHVVCVDCARDHNVLHPAEGQP